jgi:hypothetical protein
LMSGPNQKPRLLPSHGQSRQTRCETSPVERYGSSDPSSAGGPVGPVEAAFPDCPRRASIQMRSFGRRGVHHAAAGDLSVLPRCRTPPAVRHRVTGRHGLQMASARHSRSRCQRAALASATRSKVVSQFAIRKFGMGVSKMEAAIPRPAKAKAPPKRGPGTVTNLD